MLQKFLQNPITKNILIVVGLFLLIVILWSWYLRIYTHHGRSIFTPSFKGMTLEQAINLAKKNSLRIEIIDSVYESYGKPGTIVDQTPKANFPVKKNRKIFLVIKALHQPMVSMPNVVDLSLVQAQSVLENNGLKVGKVHFFEHSSFNQLVFSQMYNSNEIVAGTSIPRGSYIDLKVYVNKIANVAVPDLTGYTYQQAIQQLTRCNLNIGKVYYNSNIKSIRDSNEAIVYKQSPEAGYNSTFGQKVDIWLMLGD